MRSSETVVVIFSRYGGNESSESYNHLGFLFKSLCRLASVYRFTPSAFGVIKFILLIFRYKNVRVIAFPNSFRSLLIASILSLIVKKTYCFTWRLYPPKKFTSQLKYYTEMILIGIIGKAIVICSEQKVSIAKFAKERFYIPPLTFRAKKPISFNSNILWCSGGSDRDEEKFLEVSKEHYQAGIRTSRDKSVLSVAEAMCDNPNITFDCLDMKDLPTGPDIFLIIKNLDNPAGLTTLFENLYAGQRFILSKHLSLEYVKNHGMTSKITNKTISYLTSSYKQTLSIILG